MRNRARLQSIAPLFTQLLGCLGIRLQAWIARVASFSSRPTLDLSSAISDRITDIRSLEDARSFLFSLLEEYLGVYIANFSRDRSRIVKDERDITRYFDGEGVRALFVRKIKKRNKFFRNFLRFIKIKIARHVFLNIFLETL